MATEKGFAMNLTWLYDPVLCSYMAETPIGKYHCVRTINDVSKLFLDGEHLYTASNHTDAMEFAEAHYALSTAEEE
jgi:hypothetical protein